MGFFGGGGVEGSLHPSLKAYVDCFHSSPFPKHYPRAGGIWDQDPELIADFRTIRKFELDWKEQQEALREAGSETGGGGDPLGVGSALDEFIQGLEDEGETVF